MLYKASIRLRCYLKVFKKSYIVIIPKVRKQDVTDAICLQALKVVATLHACRHGCHMPAGIKGGSHATRLQAQMLHACRH